MPGRLGIKAAVFGLVLAAGALVLSAPASAIQTTTWGVQPAAQAGHARGSFAYPSNGQTVHDTLQVYNLTGAPATITLSVLGATQVGSSYVYSRKAVGVAPTVSLAGYKVTVPAHEQANIPVTIRMPHHSKVTTLTGIAAQGASMDRGALTIEARLVVLVKATPSTKPAPVPDIGLWGPVAAAMLVVVGGVAGREIRKRRQDHRPMAVLGPSEREEPSSAIRVPVG